MISLGHRIIYHRRLAVGEFWISKPSIISHKFVEFICQFSYGKSVIEKSLFSPRKKGQE